MTTEKEQPLQVNNAINFQEGEQLEDDNDEENKPMPLIRGKRSNVVDCPEGYNFRVAIDSWDQIGSLASEVATSVLAQLAESMSEQMREENRAAKRRKITTPTHIHFSEEPTLVSSDDDESRDILLLEPISRDLSQKIDRMARMSKYMMQIEHYHRLLRTEMLSVAEDDLDLL